MGLHSLVITKVHGCLCWSSHCSGEIARAQSELLLPVSAVKNLHQRKNGIKIKRRNNEFKDFFNFSSSVIILEAA